VPIAHAALAFASLLVVPLAGCRSFGGAGKVDQPTADAPVAAGAMGGPDSRLESRLPNGVRVIVEENHAAPLVAIQVWLSVGAADDPPQLTGAAHLYEHLLFRGTRRRAPGAAAREIEAAGGTLGAWTGLDETVYHATVAAPFFDLGLDVLGDALGAPTFDPAEVERAKTATLAEIAREAADPAHVAADLLRGAAFAGEPQGRPILGTREAVGARTAAELAARFAETYVGANMTVVIVGDVAGRAAREAVAHAFGGIAPGKAAVHAAEAPPPAIPSHALLSTAAGLEPQAAIGFRAAALSPKEAAALDLIATLLARGAEARLSRELVDNRQVATGVRGVTLRSRGGTLLELAVSPAPQRIEAAAQAAIDEALRLGREELTTDEIAQARAALESDLARGEAGPEGHARRLGFSAVVAGDLDDGAHYRARLAALGPAELRAAAEKLLRPEALTLAVVDSGAARSASAESARLDLIVAGAAARAQRSSPSFPAPATARGDVVRVVAPSGLRILVLRRPAAPSVSVEASWAGGTRAEDAGSNGAAALLAAMLDRGTRTRSAAEIAAEVKAAGGRLAGFSDRSHFGLRADFLPGAWSRGLALVADCLLRPTFPAAEVDGSRRVVVDRARGSDGDPARTAWKLFRAALWPGHPDRLDPLGTAESLAALGRIRLFDHYRRHYPISHLVISVVGDVEPRDVVATVSRLFAEAPAGASPPQPPPEPVRAEPVQLFGTTSRDVAEIVLGYPGPPPADPDRPALAVLAEILSTPGGRLEQALAATQPAIYRSAASVAPGVDPGYLAIELACPPAGVDAAVATLRAALSQLAAAGVTDAETARAARRLAGLRALELGDQASIADALALDEGYGLGLMSYRRLPTTLARVTSADVNRALRRFVDPRREAIAVVRPDPTSALARRTSPPGAH
jgi:zinc protease